jgi:hypothetical protein
MEHHTMQWRQEHEAYVNRRKNNISDSRTSSTIISFLILA